MRPLVTLSGLDQVAICPGSAALPKYGVVSAKTSGGSARHEYLEVLVEHGRDAADEAMGAIAERWGLDEPEAFFADVRTFRPPIGGGGLAEAALALLDGGEVVAVVGGRGEYEALDGTVIAGSIDCLWSEPEPLERADGAARCPAGSTLWVVDWKWGQPAYVPPVGQNWQIRAGALLAARWTGARRVVPAICFPRSGAGLWDVGTDGAGEAAPLTGAELDAIEADLRRVVASAQAQVEIYEREGPRRLRLVTGDHCNRCKARAGCPAHVGEMHALVTAGEELLRAAPLTEERALWLASVLTRLHGLGESIASVLRPYVEEHGALPLPGGRLYGPQEEERARYGTRISYEELFAAVALLVGEEAAGPIADSAFETSKSAMADALRTAAERSGLPRLPRGALKRLLDSIEARGGITRAPGQRWGAHYPNARKEDAA